MYYESDNDVSWSPSERCTCTCPGKKTGCHATSCICECRTCLGLGEDDEYDEDGDPRELDFN